MCSSPSSGLHCYLDLNQDIAQVDHNENDGSLLFELLSGSDTVNVPHIMSRLEGPYAFVFYQVC